MDRLDAERRLLEPHRKSQDSDIIKALAKIDEVLGKLDGEYARKRLRASMIGIHLLAADRLIKSFLKKHG
jgi:hypothetical protein